MSYNPAYPATGTSQVRTDALQAQVQNSYMPAGIDYLYSLAENLRDSLILIEKSTDRLNQTWEIYNKKGGLGEENGDDDIVINVDIEELHTGDTEDFDPNVILKTNATDDDVDKLQELASEMEILIDELTANNGGTPPPLAEQMQVVVDGIRTVNDLDDLELWQNDTNPDSGVDLEDIWLDSDAEAVAYGNNLRDAVSAAQASNEEARQELRKALFTWEEFVKSSGSIIERLTRIIESMARGVKGQ